MRSTVRAGSTIIGSATGDVLVFKSIADAVKFPASHPFNIKVSSPVDSGLFEVVRCVEFDLADGRTFRVLRGRAGTSARDDIEAGWGITLYPAFVQGADGVLLNAPPELAGPTGPAGATGATGPAGAPGVTPVLEYQCLIPPFDNRGYIILGADATLVDAEAIPLSAPIDDLYTEVNLQPSTTKLGSITTDVGPGDACVPISIPITPAAYPADTVISLYVGGSNVGGAVFRLRFEA
jgi:hypothetical protein